MKNTRVSLLMKVKDPGNQEAWREFVELYRPLFLRFCRSRGLSDADAADVAQNCLAVLMRKIPDFEYQRHRGGFKRWLRTIARYELRDFRRKRRDDRADTGKLVNLEATENSPEQVWERLWLQEHLKYCLNQIRPEFEPKTFAAFQRFVIDEWPSSRICEEYNLNKNQIYIAKNRVGERLRQAMIELLGDEV